MKKYLLHKFTEQWLKDNTGLTEDISNLANSITMFEIKWGVSLKLSVNKPKENTGRWTGQSIIELIDKAARKYS